MPEEVADRSIAAVCAIYGGFDLIPPVPDGFDDCVLITDEPVRSGWRNVVVPRPEEPRLAAKHPKCRPDLYTDCDQSVWLDGSAHVVGPGFVDLVRSLLAIKDLVVWDHPEDRDCLYQEALHCHSWAKYRDVPLLDQVGHYRELGMPEHFGLWALGCIARNHTSEMRAFGDAWMAEMSRWTIQDQVSFPFLAWSHGLVFSTFGVDQLDNDLVRWVPHAEDIRGHRTTVLSLESTIIHLEDEVRTLAVKLEESNEQLGRLLGRRVVRFGLAIAASMKPLLRLVRRS